MAHDVFICHSTRDKTIADLVCAQLEQAGIRCWIAPRDIDPGVTYASAIIHAIDSSAALVAVISQSANDSKHVIKEIERAVSVGKPILPFRIEDVRPSPDLIYYLGNIHWLDAVSPPLTAHVDRVAQSIKALARINTPPVITGVSSADHLANLESEFDRVTPDEWRKKPGSKFQQLVDKLTKEKG